MKLYGKNTVIERLRSNPQSIRKIYVEHGFKGTLYIHKKARQWGIPVMPVPPSKMMKIGRDKNAQGIMIDVVDFAYVDYNDLLEKAQRKPASFVFLDGLNDPQNLGAIMRSLACLGRFAVVLPTHDSVSVTEAVIRVASGGDNFVPVARVSNLGSAIRAAKDQGFRIVGAVVRGGQSLFATNLSGPVGLVVGSEQKGIREGIKKLLDAELSIPMAHETISFNVAHATAILCYEIKKQNSHRQKIG